MGKGGSTSREVIEWRWLVKIEYDKKADALYIQLREATVDDNIDIEDGVTVDVDADGHIIGVEVLDASKRLPQSDLTKLTVEHFPVEGVRTS